ARVSTFLHSLTQRGGVNGGRSDLLAIGLVSASLVGMVLATLGLPVWVAMIGAILSAFIIPAMIKAKRHRKYIEAFEGALAESLQTVGASLRAGLTLKDSLKVASENCPEPVASEIGHALKENSFGRPI